MAEGKKAAVEVRFEDLRDRIEDVAESSGGLFDAKAIQARMVTAIRAAGEGAIEAEFAKLSKAIEAAK